MFLGMRVEEKYENDARISKHNFGSRKGHSIDSTILEKILIFDFAKRVGDSFSCNMPDSKAYCDIKLLLHEA